MVSSNSQQKYSMSNCILSISFIWKKLNAKVYCTSNDIFDITPCNCYGIQSMLECSNSNASLIFSQWWQTNSNEYYAKCAGPIAIIKSSTSYTKRVENFKRINYLERHLGNIPIFGTGNRIVFYTLNSIKDWW